MPQLGGVFLGAARQADQSRRRQRQRQHRQRLRLVAFGTGSTIVAALSAVHVARSIPAALALLACQVAALEGPGSLVRAGRAAACTVPLAVGSVLLVLAAIGLRLLQL